MSPGLDQAKTETASACILVSQASSKNMALILVKTFLAFGLKRNWSFGREGVIPNWLPSSYPLLISSIITSVKFTAVVIIYSVLWPKLVVDATSLRLGLSINCHTVPTSVHQALLTGRTEHSHFSGKGQMHQVTLLTMQGQRDGSGDGCLHWGQKSLAEDLMSWYSSWLLFLIMQIGKSTRVELLDDITSSHSIAKAGH